MNAPAPLDRDADGQVRFASAGWSKEHDVVLGGDEVQRAEVGDGVAFESAGVVEVELLYDFREGNRAARMRPSRSDPGGSTRPRRSWRRWFWWS